MSPATVECPPQGIKVSQSRKRDKYQLLEEYKHFSWKDQTHDLSKIVGEGAKLSAVVSSIDPTQKVGGKLYHRLRRLLNALVDLGLVRITANWSYGDMLERPGNGVQPTSTLITLTNRMQNSNYFANGIPEGWKAVVDHYLPDEAINAKTDPCKICTRDPSRRNRAAVAERTEPDRCRVCTRKKDRESPCKTCTRDPAKRDLKAPNRSRGCKSCPVGIVRTWKPSPCGTCAFWKNKGCTTTKKHCPYRLSICALSERKKAAWILRGIDGRKGKHHWMFVRTGKKYDNTGKCTDPGILQPALQDRLNTVQTHFENYIDDVSKRVIILRRKHQGGDYLRRSSKPQWNEKRDMVEHLLPEGNELVLDFQTRFTDPGRSKEEIKKFHDTWREAGKNFDGAVFLTLTSDPTSNDSLWDVNRHFAEAWDTYVQLLTKRFEIKRRDELIAATIDEIKRLDPNRWIDIDRRRQHNKDKVVREVETLTSSDQFKALTKREQQNAIIRIKRKIRPYLGLTPEEIYDIKVRLETRTLTDGNVVKESYRPVYVAVYEFQKNGLLHAHITIFGTTWLDNVDTIKEDWERLGQGAMVHVYAMTKNPSSGKWEWLGTPPKETRNRQPVDYLIKYLIKGLYTKEGHGMYWAMNKRFFTRAQSLDTGWVDYSDGESVWELLASLHENQIPMSIKKQQRGAPLLKAWYDRYASDTGPGVPA